jgi:hypothetical protein
MSQSSGSQFSGAKLSTQNYGSWSMTFMDFLASQAEGDRLLACLTEGVGDSAAARTRDRRVLGLLRNACTVAQGKKSQMLQVWNIMFLHIHLGHSASFRAHHYPT